MSPIKSGSENSETIALTESTESLDDSNSVRHSNVKFYIMSISIMAFALVSYIFKSIDHMESDLSSSPIAGMKGSGAFTDNVPVESSKIEDDNWEPFNTTNPHKDSFCPDAQCLNSPLCLPCDRRHFLIISTARSGSTTLLRMFNALPNMRLSGENHNTLEFISKITDNLLQNRPNILKHPVDKPTGPFSHNAIPKGSMGCLAQQITHNLNPPPLAVQKNKSVDLVEYDDGLILGFKTVRFHHANLTALEASEFLKSHYPCTKALINYQSNLTHQYESFRKTFNHNDKPEDYGGPSMDELEEFNKFQEELHANLGGSSRLIDMDRWTKDVEILNSVVDWLGYKNCRFEKIAHENDGGYATDKETVLDLGDDCLYPHV
jgi:hypothetical protein